MPGWRTAYESRRVMGLPGMSGMVRSSREMENSVCGYSTREKDASQRASVTVDNAFVIPKFKLGM